MCSRYFEDFVARLAPPGTDSSDPIGFLRRMAMAYVNFGLERPEAYRVMFMGHGKHIPADVDPAEFPGRRGIHGLTSLRIALPEFPWLPVEQMVEQLCAVQIRGLARS